MAMPGLEGQATPPLEITKDLHLEKVLPGSAGKQPGHLCPGRLEFRRDGPSAGDMAIARPLDTIKDFHESTLS
jgi:hypothetical protein